MRVLQAQCAGGVTGDAVQRLGHGQPEQRAGHVGHQQQAQGGRGARVVVGADRHGHTGFAQGGNGWQVGVAQRVVGTGQQHGHRACGLHGRNALCTQVFDVVARQCAVARCQGRATHVGKLLGMQLDGQAQRLGGLEHLLGFGQREADALAKHVHGIDQTLSGQGGQHLVAHQVDVSLAASGVFGGQGVCAQEGGAHGHAKQLPQAAGHAQLLAFVRQRQAVA
jgi:hypothetical protein